MADLNQVVSIEDLRRLARRRLPRAIFDFFDGGAEDEVTLRENRAAFERVRLLPKVLVNVAAVDMKVQLLGGQAALPLAIAPTGGSRRAASHCARHWPSCCDTASPGLDRHFSTGLSGRRDRSTGASGRAGSTLSSNHSTS